MVKTRGGANFEDLCLALCVYFSFCLTDLEESEPKSITKAVCMLYDHIREEVFAEIEEGSNKKIKQFKIGKTYTCKKKGKTFDCGDEDTFLKVGIGSRWQIHKKTDYGKHGMVVVTVITKKIARNLGYDDAEECALDIEKKLQEKFKNSEHGYGKVVNSTYYRPGRRCEKNVSGYPIYVTYSFS